MKKIFIMLLLACTAMITTKAQTDRTQQDNKPVHVIKELNFTINKYGLKDGQTYSLKKNPNTNLIESSEQIVHFSFDKRLIQRLHLIRNAFTMDEPVSYQLLHLTPGNDEKVKLRIVTDNGLQVRDENIRTNNNQEMWLMCSKNPDNPLLRDAHAIVWEEKDEVIDGYILMITSLRPDIYDKNLETSSNTFKIEGRVDANITDSLYNIYIADSYEELNNLSDDDYVACVPVVNKRFEYSVELDKPKVGCIRCIFPDGSLCSAGIALDMVPGETYHITVHNGYYDEDRDYEQRVGRFSGKSKIPGHNYDDVAPDTCAYDGSVNLDALIAATKDDILDSYSNDELIKLAKLTVNKETTENYYSIIMGKTTYTGGIHKKWNNTDPFFKLIIKQNKKMDKLIEDITDSCPSECIETFYKNILEYLTEQNQVLNKLHSKMRHLSNDGAKCQEHVSSLTEKYIEKYKEACKNQ